MFFEIAEQYKHSFQDFQPYSTIMDRDAWNSLDTAWKENTITAGESYLNYEFPYLLATDFMDFLRTGNRVRFETKCFQKRHALNALVLAECVEHKGRFLDDIINGVFSICDEHAWQLPPHNSYERSSPQLILPDVTAPVLELFSCETGAILATVHYLLKDVLDEISPFITKRIRRELQHRIVTPYLTKHFWWMGNGKEPMNNWTIWCTQNVLLSVFLTNEDQEVKRKVFEKACKSTDYFLEEYGVDGCCDEGAQYYRHAGLCLFNVMEICNAITKNAFHELYQYDKIKNIATYILHAHIHDKYYVNFADCSPVAGRSGVREFLFAKRIENINMQRFAALDFKVDLPNSLLLASENNLYYRLQNAFTVSDMKSYETLAPISHPDVYYPSVGMFCARDNHLYLAVKAGDNADSHNHNDTGSFTVYKDGKPMIIDIGVESYTKKTFSNQRYEIWTMQSAYHNLPTINGIMQKDGEDYAAKNVTYRIDETVCEIEMDIADAYPKESKLASYQRHVKLEKGKGIRIKDRFSFIRDSSSLDSVGLDSVSLDSASLSPNEVIISMMTYETPSLDASLQDVTITIGSLGTLNLCGGSLLHIEEIPVNDLRLKTAWEHSVYRILFKADMNEIEMTVS